MKYQKIISLAEKLEKFVAKNCERNVTFAFCISNFDMIGWPISFLSATRIAELSLHLAANRRNDSLVFVI